MHDALTPLRAAGNLRHTHRRSSGEEQPGRAVLNEIHVRALRRAAELSGGNQQLLLRLGASEVDYSQWTGQRELPRNIFLRLVDILTGEEEPPRARARR